DAHSAIQSFDCLGHLVIAADPCHPDVEGLIEDENLVGIVFRVSEERVLPEVVERSDVLIGAPDAGESERARFDDRPQLEELQQIVNFERPEEEALVRDEDYEAFAGEPVQSLAHRCSADADGLGQPDLVDALVGPEAKIDEELSDHPVGTLGRVGAPTLGGDSVLCWLGSVAHFGGSANTWPPDAWSVGTISRNETSTCSGIVSAWTTAEATSSGWSARTER